jgi:hypothetical protein
VPFHFGAVVVVMAFKWWRESGSAFVIAAVSLLLAGGVVPPTSASLLLRGRWSPGSNNLISYWTLAKARYTCDFSKFTILTQMGEIQKLSSTSLSIHFPLLQRAYCGLHAQTQTPSAAQFTCGQTYKMLVIAIHSFPRPRPRPRSSDPPPRRLYPPNSTQLKTRKIYPPSSVSISSFLVLRLRGC